MFTYIKQFLPKSWHFRLVNLKHTFTKFRQVHYAQNCEDIMTLSLFPKSHKGFYVDVGAHHPYRISNTYLLHKQGWRGINIDANPETIAMFKRARPQDINLQLAISDEKQTLTYYKFSDPAVNTFSQEHAEKFMDKKWISYLGETTIETQTLEETLSKHIPKNQPIDVLTIDVEGLDLAVLQSNDWNTHRPQVVIVEALDFKLEQMQEHALYQFMHKHDYDLVYVAKFSLIFTNKRPA